MLLYAILLVVHVLSSVIWLGLFPADLILRKSIRDSKGKPEEPKLILAWLKVLNIGGMIGLTGILLSGLLLTIKFDYGFFQFASGGNHWLYTKQLLMVILIILVGAFLIPGAKKVSASIKTSLNSPLLDESFYSSLTKLGVIVSVQNFIVLLNMLLALTRRFF
ncbi:MAG: hypothetical protein AB9882_09450 [Ignavibacteriaceae bacterium]